MSIPQSSADEPQHYAGAERRKCPRIEANYPICIRYGSSSGGRLERYAQTRNVSAGGVLFACMEVVEPGTQVDVLMGIPSVYAASLPAAQLNGVAQVVRSEAIGVHEEDTFGARVAMRFTETPSLSTLVTMFD